MKNLILIVMTLLLLNGYTNAQDKIYRTYNTDISYSIFERIRTVNTDQILQKKTVNFSGVRQLSFLNNDTIKLINEDNDVIKLNINDIDYVSVQKKRTSSLLYGVLGAFTGCLIGALIGENFSNDEKGTIHINGYISGGFIGAVLGTFAGLAVSGTINSDYLELDKIPFSSKKDQLIRFLNKK